MCEIDGGPAEVEENGCIIKCASTADKRYIHTVVPVMNGHLRDQAKVSVHDRWPLAGGTGGRRQT